MTFASLKRVNTRIWSLILSALILVSSLVGLGMSTDALSAAENNGLVYFADDFNRETISENGWIEKRTEGSENKIVDGVLQLTELSTSNGNYGHVGDIIMRPMSEAALNQKASVEVLNRGELSNYASANVHVRVVPKSGGYIGYFASVNNGTLQIRKTTNTGAAALTSGEVKVDANFVAGHTYRLELVAQGMHPTVLQATVYDVTDNGKVVVSAMGTDTTNDLQVSGTVALSGTSNKVDPRNIAKVDNFVYQQTDTAKYFDGFEETELDSSWVMSDATKAAPTVSNGALNLARTNTGNFAGKAIVRPKSTESSLNQLIEIDFQRTDSNAHTFGPTVLARVQSADNLQYSGPFYQVQVTLAKGGKNNSAGVLQIIRNGSDKLSINDKPKVTFNTDPKLKYRLQVSIMSNEERTSTTIIATLYKLNANGTVTKTAQVTGTDTTAALQNAGTVGLTYINAIDGTTYNSGVAIDNFYYVEQMDKPEIPLSLDPEVPFVFEDNFDRADTVINGNNGWVDQYSAVSGTTIGTIKNNTLVLQNAENFAETNSFVYGKVLRPITEASTDQRVSVDILNLGEIDSAEISLRNAGNNTTEDNIKNNHCFYLVRLSKTDLTIRTQMSFVTGRFAGVPFEYEEGHVYRIEATAQGSLPAVITATVYDVTDNNKVVATVSGSDESLVASNGRTGQISGTVGVAYIGTAPAVFDNFKYEHINTVKNYDIFNRKDGEVGNDWVNASANNSTATILSEKMVMSNGGTDGMWNALMLRPDSEAALNQSVKIEFTNDSMPQETGPAPVLFTRVKDNGTGGYSCYCARIDYKGADTTVSIYKVLDSGETVLLSEGKPMNNIHTNFGNSTQPIYFEFRAEGSSPTKLTVILYKLNNGVSQTYYYNKTVYDDQTELQSAGTAGVSYAGSTSDFDIDTFSYFETGALPEEPTGPAETDEDYMLYFYGTVSSGNFGQWVELDPDKVYVYKVRLKTTFNSGGFAPKLRYEKKAEGRVVRDFAATTTAMDEDTFYYTLTFSVPEDAHIQQNGKARIFIGIHEGGLGSMGYATDFSLVEENDTANTNLLNNSEFKQGLFGWGSQSIMIQGVWSNEFVSLTPVTEEVELLSYDALVFMRDDSDVYFDDGDWAKDYVSDNEETVTPTGTVSGQLLNAQGEPIKNAKLVLSPDSITEKTNSKGKFEFSDLSAGSYQLSLLLEDGTSYVFDQELYVSENSILTLELTYDIDPFALGDDTNADADVDDTDVDTNNTDATDNNVNANEKTTDYTIYIIIAAIVLVVVLLAATLLFIFLKKRKHSQKAK